jgi:hypothetical protein
MTDRASRTHAHDLAEDDVISKIEAKNRSINGAVLDPRAGVSPRDWL